MDLDNFKDINDTHGHHVGDRALREVAGVLRTGIRPYDICVRYAGDEFIVVLSGCGGEEAERKRLELQRAVDNLQFKKALTVYNAAFDSNADGSVTAALLSGALVLTLCLTDDFSRAGLAVGRSTEGEKTGGR